MPSTKSRTVSEVLPSSTVMTPSLPTFSKASAISLPMVGSLLALMLAPCSISAFLVNGQGEDRRRGGAVAGHVGGLLGDGVDQLGAHVLERVGQVDLLADGDAVLGDGRPAKALVEDDVAPGRAEGQADRVGQL